MKVRGRFYLAFTVQMLLLLFIVVAKQNSTKVGYQFVLPSVPVDRHQPFDGDDLLLRFAISSLPRPAFDPAVGDHVYVALGSDDEAPAVQPVRPGDGRVWLCGRVTARSQGRIDVEYGIERYRLPDLQTRPIDWDTDTLAVDLRIDGAGRAAIYRLLVDGKPVEPS